MELFVFRRKCSDACINENVFFLRFDEEGFQSGLVLCTLVFSEDEEALVQGKVTVS